MTDTQNTGSTGILGEIKEGIHELEQKVENFIHPSAAGNASSSALNSASGDTAAVQNADALAEQGATAGTAPASGPTTSAEGANVGEPSSSPTSGSPGSGDATHTDILRKIVTILRRDYNILGGELESWVKTAEQAL